MTAPAGRETAEGAAYACVARLGGVGVRLRIATPMLEWTVGAQQGRIALADVVAVHLRFQAAKFGGSSYETEIVAQDGTRLRIGSVTRTSLTGVRDQKAEYAAFVRALHGVLAEDPPPRRVGARIYRGGFPPWRFWMMAAMGSVAAAGLVAVVGLALAERQWTYALFLAALAAFVGWPTAELIWRNRPLDYTPQAIPAHLLPA